MNLRAEWFSLFFLIFLVNCKPTASTDDIPSYINISTAELTTDPASEGASTHSITDGWVYVNDNISGVFELPSTVPLLHHGTQKITVQAGIKINGISSTRATYPFYLPFTVFSDLKPAQTDTILPTFTYVPGLVFSMNENFELGNAFDNVTRITDSEIVAYGSSAGKIIIHDTADIAVALAIDWLVLPKGGEPVYIELDYKNNHTFMVGLQAQRGAEVGGLIKLTINPRENWNKIYINITPEITELDADRYKLFLRVDRNEGETPLIYIDNVKIVHYN